MPKLRENPRIKTYNKLIKVGKSTEKDILNIKIEDLEDVIEDPDFKNIILLRKYIKEHNAIGYFNYSQTKKGEEEH